MQYMTLVSHLVSVQMSKYWQSCSYCGLLWCRYLYSSSFLSTCTWWFCSTNIRHNVRMKYRHIIALWDKSLCHLTMACKVLMSFFPVVTSLQIFILLCWALCLVNLDVGEGYGEDYSGVDLKGEPDVFFYRIIIAILVSTAKFSLLEFTSEGSKWDLFWKGFVHCCC